MSHRSPAPRPNLRLSNVERNGSDVSWLRWFWLPLATCLLTIALAALR